MKKVETLLYKSSKYGWVIKKQYRYENAFIKGDKNALDASKLPDDVDYSGFEYVIGTNSHSTNFPAFDVTFFHANRWEPSSTTYFTVYNIQDAPIDFLKRCVECLKAYEREYYRALEELGEAGRLLKEL